MSVSYDTFTGAFLHKVTEYEFLKLNEYDRMSTVDGYMKRACAQFNRLCVYDLKDYDDEERVFNVDIPPADLDEIVEIVTEGMLVQWMKPYYYNADVLANTLNTADFTSYSPAELLYRITNAYNEAQRDFRNMMNEYSYNHGDLKGLSL